MANIADLAAQGADVYASAAAENTASITTVMSVLYGFDGRNTDTSNAVYIQVFDLAAAPVSTVSVPEICIGVPAAGSGATISNGNYSYSSASSFGQLFKKGIQIAASSTDFPTYTSVATNKTMFHVEYAKEDGLSF